MFTVAGIATDKNGNTKVRYTNDLQSRVKKLYSDNFTNINFVELGREMTKLEACKHLLTIDIFKDYNSFIQKAIVEIEVSQK